MKLITEEIEQVEFLVENKNCKKSSIEGVFLQGNITNRNGRMYPMETLRKEVGRYNENHIQSDVLMNLDIQKDQQYPIEFHTRLFLLKKVVLTSLNVDSGTPMGKIANLVEEGVKLGVSSRGIDP